jgi:hypothetical protein
MMSPSSTNDIASQHERLDHEPPAQVERAVAQAQRLVELDLVFERKRRRQRLGEQLHVRRLQLDLARRQVRVDVVRVALHVRRRRTPRAGARPR